MKFARAKYAFGFCDRCGFRADLSDLHAQILDTRDTNLLVCDSCLDEDQPQLQVGRIPVNDPQALYNPRPDIAQQASRNLFGWNPVGNNAIMLQGQIGSVTVVI
ncbi:MAG: hypothetical protein JW384_04298 [Nitrosomonadaceae bacterium]|nr:hypothetical protein [Nitrosomonadaceae bacterium]